MASSDIIRRLLARGLTGQQIGQAIGRDRSLISQVGRGRKPGSNLEGALGALEARLDAGQGLGGVEPPARRTTRAGRAARVRRPTTVGRGNWSTSTIKRQAAGSGGRSLDRVIEQAGANGQRCAATIVFHRRVKVLQSYGPKAGPHAVDFEFDPDEYLNSGERPDAAGWLVGEAHRRGMVPADVDAGDVESIEVRVF